MNKVMKALCLTDNNTVELKHVPTPEKAEPGHLLIKMEACGINPGDKAFLNGVFAGGTIPVSRYDVCGVSGSGTVLEIGSGVPETYKGKQVTVYRSLKFSDTMIGTWCEYAHLPYLQCAILPDNVKVDDYAGSLVNCITPYSFLKQIMEEGHKGILCTAGTSATGIAMLGVCLTYNFPLLTIVRNEAGKKELEALGAKNIVVQSDEDFKKQLSEKAATLDSTAVFDGVGGELLSKIIEALPRNATVYSYGYLGGHVPLSIPTSALMSKNITIKSFGNFKSKTVQDPQLLEKALNDISSMLHLPHFKTKTGKAFKLEEIKEALQFVSEDGSKAVLYPSL